jgi:hypothetical protein
MEDIAKLFNFQIQTPLPVIILSLVIIGIIIFVAITMYYSQYRKNLRSHNQQLFLYKAKNLGLKTFQIKILNEMVNALKLQNANLLLHDRELFETAMGKFFAFLEMQNETQDSVYTICKDITIIHEKVYHAVEYRKPIEKITDVEDNTLLAFMTGDGTAFIGRIIGKDRKTISARIFRKSGNLRRHADNPVNAYFWRNGDAEYSFTSKIVTIERDVIDIDASVPLVRGTEVRRPYIEVLLPCTVTDPRDEEAAVEGGEKQEKEKEEDQKGRGEEKKGRVAVEDASTGTIYKLNENEIILRTIKKMDFQKEYFLNFTIADFRMKVKVRIIIDRTITEEQVIYYTFRITELSGTAKKILKQYIIDRL